METKNAKNQDIIFAAQNARLGLITVRDLSLLTGVEATRLNNFAKKGHMNHYGEYQGKRFFNFEEIVNWLHDSDETNEAKPVIRTGMKEILEDENCPYSIEKNARGVRLVWNEV